MTYDFLIVGGGVAGCYTAMKLKEKYPDDNILLVEKTNRLGGRLHSIKIKEGTIEAGAARFSNRHKLLNKLIDNLDLSKKKNKIGSTVQFISSKKNKSKYNKLAVETLMRNLVYKAKDYPKSFLIKHTLTTFCLKIYGEEKTEFLINAFPYYARINNMNLYDCLRSLNDYIDYKRQFYSLTDGLQQVPLECAKRFKKNGGKIRKNTQLLDLNYNGIDSTGEKCFTVLLENKEGVIKPIQAKKVIIAIPQEFLKKISYFNRNNKIKELVDSVRPYELMRIYAKYPLDKKTGKVWFNDLPIKISTDNKIKFIIQINPKEGIIMIAYPNSDFTHFWNKKKSTEEIETSLNKYLKQIFPDKHIPKSIWIKPFFWNTGGNIWLPGRDSDILSKKMLKPSDDPLYVVGECYSQWQAWVEGALETSTKLLKII